MLLWVHPLVANFVCYTFFVLGRCTGGFRKALRMLKTVNQNSKGVGHKTKTMSWKILKRWLFFVVLSPWVTLFTLHIVTWPIAHTKIMISAALICMVQVLIRLTTVEGGWEDEGIAAMTLQICWFRYCDMDKLRCRFIVVIVRVNYLPITVVGLIIHYKWMDTQTKH